MQHQVQATWPIGLGLTPVPARTPAVSSDAHLGVDDAAAMVTPYAPGLGIMRAAIPAKLIERVLCLLRDAFDHVVVHTSRGFGDHVLAALDGTDVLLLPATLDIPALKTLQATMDTLQLLNYPRERQRIVMLGQSKAGLLLSEVEKSLRMPVRGQLPYPPDARRQRRCPDCACRSRPSDQPGPATIRRRVPHRAAPAAGKRTNLAKPAARPPGRDTGDAAARPRRADGANMVG